MLQYRAAIQHSRVPAAEELAYPVGKYRIAHLRNENVEMKISTREAFLYVTNRLDTTGQPKGSESAEL